MYVNSSRLTTNTVHSGTRDVCYVEDSVRSNTRLQIVESIVQMRTVIALNNIIQILTCLLWITKNVPFVRRI